MKTETANYITAASAETLNPRYVAALSFDNGNLIPDSSFEDAANSVETTWNIARPGTLFDNSGEASGSSATLTASSSIIYCENKKYIPAVISEQFIVSARIYVSSNFDGRCGIGVTTFDSSKTNLLSWPMLTKNYTELSLGEWQTITGVLTISAADSAYINFFLTIRETATVGYVIYDDASITRADTSNRDDFDGDITFLTSHNDAVLPSDDNTVLSIDRIDGCIQSISGQSQFISPDKAQHSIGSISIKLLDVNSELSTKINTKLTGGNGLRNKRIVLYKGDELLTAWADYSKRLTYLIDGVSYKDGVYTLSCSDIQRTTKTDIFELDQGVLTSTITDTQTTIPVTIAGAETKFQLLEHDAFYTSNPSVTVGYIKIDDEVICHSGWTDSNYNTLQVVERGAMNTSAISHEVTAIEDDQKKKVDEYIYLEMPAPKLIYALLTGIIYGQTGTMPDRWNLGVSVEYVTLGDFTGIGDDLWNTTASVKSEAGRFARFIGVEKTEGKSFIENELLLWMGAFMPINASGAYRLKRLQSVLPYSSAQAVLNESQITGYSDLIYDQKSVINNIAINWNWIDSLERFTKTTQLVDSNSVSKYGYASLKTYNFKGVFTGVHTDNDIFNYFNQNISRYAAPPLKITLDVLPKWDKLEVGDTIRIDCANIHDINSGESLSRVFEVQRITTDWITGKVSLTLFGGVESAHLNFSNSDYSLTDTYWATGTDLNTVLNIVSGVVQASAVLSGADNHSDAVYYYAGDLTIPSGVIISSDKNIELRIKGHLQIDGEITTKGGGAAGGAGGTGYAVATSPWIPHYNVAAAAGISGIFGTTSINNGLNYFAPRSGHTTSHDLISTLNLQWSVYPDNMPVTAGQWDELPSLNLINSTGDNIYGLPDSLIGTGGGGGDQSVELSYENLIANGGAGGAGGGGLYIIARGMSFGLSGSIDVSGGDGGSANSGVSNGKTIYSGGGSGGYPGACIILIDGYGSTPSTSHIKTSSGVIDSPTVDVLLTAADMVAGRYDVGGNIGANTSAALFLPILNGSDEHKDGLIYIGYVPPALNGYTWLPADEAQEVTGYLNKPQSWTTIVDDGGKPANYATVGAEWGINISGSNLPADNATAGATWGADIASQPSDNDLLNANTTWTQIAGTANAPANNATAGATWGSNISSQPADSVLLNSYQEWSDVNNSSEILKRYNGADLATDNKEYYISCEVDNGQGVTGWYKVASFTLVNPYTAWSFAGTMNWGSSAGRYYYSARVSMGGIISTGTPMGLSGQLFKVSADNQSDFDTKFKLYREGIGDPITSYKWTLYAQLFSYSAARIEGVWRKGSNATAWIDDYQTYYASLGTTYSPAGTLLTPSFNYEPGADVTDYDAAALDAQNRADEAIIVAQSFTEGWSDEGATVGADWDVTMLNKPSDEAILNSYLRHDADVTVTVGSGGDYTSISSAIAVLTQQFPTYTAAGVQAEIQLLAGFVMEEQLTVYSVNLSWIRITGVDATTTFDVSSPTANNLNGLLYGVSKFLFAAHDGGVLPIIDQTFVMSAWTSTIGGILCYKPGSKVIMLPGTGIGNANTGIVVYNGAHVLCDKTDFYTGYTYGGTIDASSNSFVDADDSKFRSITAAYGSSINFNRSYGYQAPSTGPILAAIGNSSISAEGAVINTSTVNVIDLVRATINSNIDIDGATIGGTSAFQTGLSVEKGSRASCTSVDFSAATTVGIESLQGSIINASGSIGTLSQTANTVTANGIIFK